MNYPEQADYLSILSRSPAAAVKDFAEELLPELGAVEVLENRTGLVMVPMRDTAQGAAFYLGEVMIAAARVRLGGAEGYGACLGRDLTQALAIALLDAALATGLHRERVTAFVQAQAADLTAAEQALDSQIELTRVELETF